MFSEPQHRLKIGLKRFGSEVNLCFVAGTVSPIRKSGQTAGVAKSVGGGGAEVGAEPSEGWEKIGGKGIVRDDVPEEIFVIVL